MRRGAKRSCGAVHLRTDLNEPARGGVGDEVLGAEEAELEDALRKLQLQKVEQELDQIIEQGVKDKARFQELLHLQKQLSK